MRKWRLVLHTSWHGKACALLAAALLLLALPSIAQKPDEPVHPWSDRSLDPGVRADMVLREMTIEEKVDLLHGTSGVPLGVLGAGAADRQSNGGAGMFGGVPRLGIPPLQMADAAYGVTHGRATGRYATALPSPLALAASWEPELAYRYGALLGRELRAQGYNMSLGGGVNLAREPRDGRTFEYLGEDPLLAGTMAGHMIRGIQAQNVLATIKHFALNDQEDGRNAANVLIGERAMRETDLRAFETGIRLGDPAAVMCSYNRIVGEYACENSHLLTGILRNEWKFKGFVLSDWGATHSGVKALRAGLDNEEPNARWFGPSLLQAVRSGEVTQAEIDEHARRILRSQFATGAVDRPMQRSVPDVEAGLAETQAIAERSLVLLKNRTLKNEQRLLPLDPATVKSIAVIGGHADAGMISGGGSAQVDPPGGSIVPSADPVPAAPFSLTPVWFPDAPLKALRARFPHMNIVFDSGADPAHAATIARAADVAIVFGWQWEAESIDLPTLSLDPRQNDLISSVTAANPQTVVAIESGGPVTMPWSLQAAGIVEVWYPGSRGAEALTAALAGDINPSARLPISFPLHDADLPHPTLVQPPPASRPLPFSIPMEERAPHVLPPFPLRYDEDLKVGYAWYDAEDKTVLFPFGFGLSYTSFAYSNLTVSPVKQGLRIDFTLRNIGARDREEISQIYAALPSSAQEPPKRLVQWTRTPLAPGETRKITTLVDARSLAVYDVATASWNMPGGVYTIRLGGSSDALSATATIRLPATPIP